MLAGDSTSSGPDVAQHSAASSPAQVLAAGWVSVLGVSVQMGTVAKWLSDDLASLSGAQPWPWNCDNSGAWHPTKDPLECLLIFSLVCLKLCPPVQAGHSELVWPNPRDALTVIPGMRQIPGEGGCVQWLVTSACGCSWEVTVGCGL